MAHRSSRGPTGAGAFFLNLSAIVVGLLVNLTAVVILFALIGKLDEPAYEQGGFLRMAVLLAAALCFFVGIFFAGKTAQMLGVDASGPAFGTALLSFFAPWNLLIYAVYIFEATFGH